MADLVGIGPVWATPTKTDAAAPLGPEGLAALARHDVNVSAALEVINASSGRSNASQNLIPQRVVTREFPCTFALGLLAKDCGIAVDVVNEVGGSAPLLAQTIREVFEHGSVTSLFDGNA